MKAINRPYWTLVEAAAWVTFRDMRVVDLFSHARRGAWSAFMAYPSEREAYKEVGRYLDLFDALAVDRLQAYGHARSQDLRLEPIPTIDWHDLIPDVDGPYRRNAVGMKIEPWLDIRLKRADVERHWRRQSEIDGRSRYDKEWFRQRHAAIREQKPELSKNELIEELQAEYQSEKNREPPGRSTVQRYLKGL